MRYIFLFLFNLISCISVIATHIVGGELYYGNLGNDQYRITLKCYRDCYNGQAPFDNPAYVFIYNSSGTLVQTVEMYNPTVTAIPLTSNDPCLTPPSNVCVEEGLYQTDVYLSPVTGGYDLVYQRCCRNHTIVNLVNPGGTGSTYVAHIPGSEVVSKNSSPHFNNFPPVFLCINNEIDFDHSATDADGDLLVYELCSPYLGADSSCPAPSPFNSNCPTPTLPYTSVQWGNGYSGTYPLNSSPAISINSSSGLLNGKPTLSGQFVVGVCVSEFRNGVLLSTTKRDFQFNILDCENVFVTIPAQQLFCDGYTYSYTNTNSKAVKYYWDFGDPNTKTDTSTLKSPTYTYSDSGTYTIMHVAWNNGGCVDTAYTTVTIYPQLDPSIKPVNGQCISYNNFDFYADGSFQSYATFSWSFGTNATPSSSTVQNPQDIIFSSSGMQYISLTVTENGCTETVTDCAEIYPLPLASFLIPEQSGCEPFTVLFSDNSTSGTPLAYYWDFGDGNTSNEANPLHTYEDDGTYDVSLTVISSNGCIDTNIFFQNDLIEVIQSPDAGIGVDEMEKSIFEPIFDFADLSQNANSCLVEMGDGNLWPDLGNFTYEYSDTGNYQIVQVVYNDLGCTDTARITIRVKPEYRFFIPNTFSPNDDQLNEVFIPKTMGIDEYSFYIYDRWGKIVFETTDPQLGWNGKMMNTGKMSADGVYTYLIRFGNVFKKQFEYRGIVTLVR
jgi:gliding motility-associated-like protein